MDRKTLLSLEDAALSLGASTFARDISRSWLGQWPGDFRVRGFLAQAYQQLNDLGSAARHLEIALTADPEEVAFYRLAGSIQTALGQEEAASESLGFACALLPDPVASPLPLPAWTERLRLGLSQIEAHNYDQAQALVAEVERARPQSLLPHWLQLKIAWLAGDYETVLRLGAPTRQRWPGCAAVLLALAQASLASGGSTPAVELLHLAAVADPAHEVATRMLGAFNPYLALWPSELQATIPWPIPSAVAFAAGLNKLSAMASDGSAPAGADQAPGPELPLESQSTPEAAALAALSDQSDEAVDSLAKQQDGAPSGKTARPTEPASPSASSAHSQEDEKPAEIRPLPGEHFRGPSGGAASAAKASVPSSAAVSSAADEGPVEVRPLPGEHFRGPSGGSDSSAEPTQPGPAASSPALGEEPAGIGPLPGEHFRGPSGKVPPTELGAAGDPSASQGQDAELEQVRAELDRVARRLRMHKKLGEQDRRRHSLILLSSLANLKTQYGPDGTAAICRALSALARSVASRDGWSAHTIYVDDKESLRPFHLLAVAASNPAEVKQLVSKLEAALAKRGETIGALLIVGGHDIIPFHRLPNPADDDDHEVPSDNPYATGDDNYFLPEWPVSRLPNPAGGDPQFLLRAIERIMEARTARPPTAVAQLAGWVGLLFDPTARRFHKSLGYTAGIWRSASLGASRPIGKPGSMLVSPPVDADTLPVADLSFPRCCYFNLHGLEQAAEWFGQRSPDAPESMVEFPTALRPDQVSDSGRAPDVVFSEACYGANVLGKTTDSALALKFLDSGTQAFVGSTKIAYGAAAPPLIGADLVALYYWQNLARGLLSAEALRQAKLRFAEEMRQRQGYLDGEDQKTLISFIHLGDPLFAPPEFAHSTQAKASLPNPVRPANPELLRVKALDDASLASLPTDLVGSLREVLKGSLPAMSDGRARVYETQANALRTAETPKGAEAGAPSALPAWVGSLDKRFEDHGSGHAQYARASLDSTGRLIKLVVSR